MNMENKCLLIKRHKFLFWKWISEENNHNWAYHEDLKQRKCLNCGRKEILFKTYKVTNSLGDDIIEDWRLKY